MNIIVRRLLKRARKLALLLLLLPLLTGAAAYVFAKKAPITYEATAEVMLGSFENAYLTNPVKMKNVIPSDSFLEEINDKYNTGFNIADVQSKLNIVPSNAENTLKFSYRDRNEAKAEETLSKIIDAFLEESNKKLNEKIQLTINDIEDLNRTSTQVESIDKITERHKLNQQLLDYELKTKILNGVNVGVANPISPVQRAVLGFLVGLILSIFILVLPELFISTKQEKAME
jgi:teichuronic acid biosynthesis protein TuaF